MLNNQLSKKEINNLLDSFFYLSSLIPILYLFFLNTGNKLFFNFIGILCIIIISFILNKLYLTVKNINYFSLFDRQTYQNFQYENTNKEDQIKAFFVFLSFALSFSFLIGFSIEYHTHLQFFFTWLTYFIGIYLISHAFNMILTFKKL